MRTAADSIDFDLDGALRRLERRLTELTGPPSVAGTLSNSGPLTAADHQFLIGRIDEHWLLHEASGRTSPRCPKPDLECKALGAVQAIAFALREIGAFEADRPLFDARGAVQEHLASGRRLLAKLTALDELHDRRHEGSWRIKHEHELRCVPVKAYAAELAATISRLEKFDAVSLYPYLPLHLREGFDRGLVTMMEGLLTDHSWEPDEIIAVIDDVQHGAALGTSAVARKDRLRKRMERLREKSKS